jgi:hypothetical protein
MSKLTTGVLAADKQPTGAQLNRHLQGQPRNADDLRMFPQIQSQQQSFVDSADDRKQLQYHTQSKLSYDAQGHASQN